MVPNPCLPATSLTFPSSLVGWSAGPREAARLALRPRREWFRIPASQPPRSLFQARSLAGRQVLGKQRVSRFALAANGSESLPPSHLAHFSKLARWLVGRSSGSSASRASPSPRMVPNPCLPANSQALFAKFLRKSHESDV